MRIDKGVMVALGYGKFFRSDSIARPTTSRSSRFAPGLRVSKMKAIEPLLPFNRSTAHA
jgi:hypothetical protein